MADHADLSDERHCALVNELISVLNDKNCCARHRCFTASAAVAAAAAYATFTLSEGYTVDVTEADLFDATAIYLGRMRECLEQQKRGQLYSGPLH